MLSNSQNIPKAQAYPHLYRTYESKEILSIERTQVNPIIYEDDKVLTDHAQPTIDGLSRTETTTYQKVLQI